MTIVQSPSHPPAPSIAVLEGAREHFECVCPCLCVCVCVCTCVGEGYGCVYRGGGSLSPTTEDRGCRIAFRVWVSDSGYGWIEKGS